MSSLYVRDQIKSFLASGAPDESIIDLTGQFDNIAELLDEAGIVDAPWLGIEFIGGDEIPVTVPATNTSGKYRETGAIHFHVVDISALGKVSDTIDRAEALRDLLRGQRIGSITIESVQTVNFGAGAVLRFEGGYTSGSFLVSYIRDQDL